MNDNSGPLQDGSTAVVIGGGPGGSGCAIALKRLSREMGRNIEVVLYEGKSFTEEGSYNQCIGVLSPPVDRILERHLGIRFPDHLVQRRITGYVLHTPHRRITLDSDEEPSYALRRIQFDEYLLEQARLQGVRVIHSRVTGLEFRDREVMIFSESDNRRAAVIVGAFGLDEGTIAFMEHALPYQKPRFLDSIVAKIIPPAEEMQTFGNRIHAFLPSIPRIEFGAITPKSQHLAVNIAGTGINVAVMEAFLDSGPVRGIIPSLPPLNQEHPGPLSFFKGRFPISIAQGFYGNRYVLVGDAAGLVRAFKGKGVNSACLSGFWAADVILKHGVSRDAFAEHYGRACQEILTDLPYGRVVRRMVKTGRRLGLLDRLILVAQNEPALQAALFDAVSGNQPYRNIVRSLMRPALLAKVGSGLLRPGNHHGGSGA